MCVCCGLGIYLDIWTKAAFSHHGNVLSCLLEFIFDTASDVSEVRQRELFKLDRAQNASVGLKHLQSLNNTNTAGDKVL